MTRREFSKLFTIGMIGAFVGGPESFFVPRPDMTTYPVSLDTLEQIVKEYFMPKVIDMILKNPNVLYDNLKYGRNITPIVWPAVKP